MKKLSYLLLAILFPFVMAGCDEGSGGEEPNTLLQEALDEYKELYVEMITGPYFAIDNDYSTLDARESLTPSSPVLWNFWEKAYGVINFSNRIIQLVDADDTISTEKKREHTGRAELYRATAYIFLTTLFGDVPLTTSYETPWAALPATSAEDINQFAAESLDAAITKLPQDESVQAYFAKMLWAMRMGEYPTVRLTMGVLTEYDVLVVDTNSDGKLDVNDVNETSTMAVQAYLLSSEAALEIGETMLAAEYLVPLGKTQAASADEVLNFVKNFWPSWNSGMKFMNAERWGDTAAWGKCALLPIPDQAISASDGNLQQNQGW